MSNPVTEAEVEAALRPFADAVYNDNGDMTVSWVTDSESYIKAYFIWKRISAAAKERAGEQVQASDHQFWRKWPNAKPQVATTPASPSAGEIETAWNTLERLRAQEGHSVTFICDNPDFNEQPNSVVECMGDWTDWRILRFTGNTVFDALHNAYIASTVLPHPSDPENGDLSLSPPPPEWRGIESAPRDGTKVLIFLSSDDDGECYKVAYWSNLAARPGWFYRGGWCEQNEPDCWMPLPAAPDSDATT